MPESRERGIRDIIREYREKKIEGLFLDLVPYRTDLSPEIVRLRNRERNRHFLAQNEEITPESQLAWGERYLLREDDIYWCLFRKEGDFIGTIRLYDIAPDGSSLTQGSFMIDETYSGEAPYAVEAELLSLDFAFDRIKVQSVINEDRADNRIMNSLTKRMGFRFVKDTVIRGASYRYYLLSEEDYRKKRGKAEELLRYWKER